MPWIHNGSEGLDARSDYGKIIAALVPLTTCMAIITSLRAYVRFVIIKAIGPDDWIVFYSAVFCSLLPFRARKLILGR